MIDFRPQLLQKKLQNLFNNILGEKIECLENKLQDYDNMLKENKQIQDLDGYSTSNVELT